MPQGSKRRIIGEDLPSMIDPLALARKPLPTRSSDPAIFRPSLAD